MDSFREIRCFVRDLVTNRTSVLFLFLGFASLTLCGAGNPLVISVLCMCLSVGGFFTESVRIDLPVFFCLSGMFCMGTLSSYLVSGHCFSGYSATWLLFVLMYVITCSLSDMERRLLHRLLVFWAGLIVSFGIIAYSIGSFSGSPGRFGWLIENPNAMGIFIVIAWFLALQEGVTRLEPVLLVGLGMTLSMGSFLSMGVALLYLSWIYYRQFGFKNMVSRTASLGVRIVVCLYVGFLFYFSSTGRCPRGLCLFPFVLLLFLFLSWSRVSEFLEDKRRIFVVIVLMIIVLCSFAMYLRPSSVDTFVERLYMMRSGFRYLFDNPLLGIGQYNWRGVDYSDGGIYFNTWYIHNAFLHVGVEVGIVVMVCMICIPVRYLIRFGYDTDVGWVAFVVHSLIDVGFFYTCIPALVLLGHVGDHERGYRVPVCLKYMFFCICFIVSVLYFRSGGAL